MTRDNNFSKDQFEIDDSTHIPTKTRLLGLFWNTDIYDNPQPSDLRIVTTQFGYHVLNLTLILLFIVLVAFKVNLASEGDFFALRSIINYTVFLTMTISIWSIFHKRIVGLLSYNLFLSLVYFLILMTFRNSVYGGMAIQSLITFFEISIFGFGGALLIHFFNFKRIDPLSFLKH